MSIENVTKINHLLSTLPSGIVLQSSWLEEQGYSLALQDRYKRSQWFKSIGSGALIRNNDQVGYEGAVYALQTQSGMTIHPGGRTALSLLGNSHYIEVSAKRVILFRPRKDKLPTWFRNYDWGVKIEDYSSSFLPADLGLVDIDVKSFSIRVSGAARALFECLYLAPEKQDLIECYEVLEGLNNLSPAKVQILLEQCTSIKVKRLFLYLAEKAGHAWFKALDLKTVDLGSGKRSIVKNGVYIAKYKITIPRELAQNDKTEI